MHLLFEPTWDMLKSFLFALFLSHAVGTLIVAHAQTHDASGFISLDCGYQGPSYVNEVSTIYYTSDAGFIDSGESKNISTHFQLNTGDDKSRSTDSSPPGEDDKVSWWYLNVRSFPQGRRNCYTLGGSKGNKYLIRARFMYGNYDGRNSPPQFDLRIGVDLWVTLAFNESSDKITEEIIHVPTSDYISVCLINTGHGTPFISVLELRPMNNFIYVTEPVSLDLYLRWDPGSEDGYMVRYINDMYDRIWDTYEDDSYGTLNTSLDVLPTNENSYQPPSLVMSDAMTLKDYDTSGSLTISLSNITDPADQYYFYFYFAELEELLPNQSREFDILVNGKPWSTEPVVPKYLLATTIYSLWPFSLLSSNSTSQLEFSFVKTKSSTHPPILNGIEVYTVKNLSGLETDQNDVTAIRAIKSVYGLTRNWEGDPCSPAVYLWDGLKCNYSGPPRIIALNLSSSGLTGNISPYLSNLTMIESLDLSNNKLTGQVPNFLSQMESLKILKLERNNFDGSIPADLHMKSKNGSLIFSADHVGGNKTTQKFIIPVAASVASLVVLLLGLVILLVAKSRKQVSAVMKMDVESDTIDKVRRSHQFSFSEVLHITNNLSRVIGKGSSGTIYHGYLHDTEVAVKMIFPSSTGTGVYKAFQAEANTLMRVQHKNLTSCIGYCNEGTSKGLIFEYMARGNLRDNLSGKNSNVLSWSERLRIALDAAQGLEYLHHGCKPPIIHRDVKPANILLNEQFQAKLSDFGLSRAFSTDDESHISTQEVAGTRGYLAPELNEKGDVYSYGIVLLEMITNQPAIANDPGHTSISQWAASMLTNGDVKNMVDARLQGDFDVNSAWKAVELAMDCVATTTSKRPTMNYVVNELRECLAMQPIKITEQGMEDSIMMTVNTDCISDARAR